jgi:hypothetical protein
MAISAATSKVSREDVEQEAANLAFAERVFAETHGRFTDDLAELGYLPSDGMDVHVVTTPQENKFCVDAVSGDYSGQTWDSSFTSDGETVRVFGGLCEGAIRAGESPVQPTLAGRKTYLPWSLVARAEAAFFNSLRRDRQRLPTVGPSGVGPRRREASRGARPQDRRVTCGLVTLFPRAGFLGPLLGTGALDRPKKGRRYGTDFGDLLGRLGCDLDPNRHRRWSVYRSSFEALDLRTNQAVDTGASPTGGLKGELLTADAADVNPPAEPHT